MHWKSEIVVQKGDSALNSYFLHSTVKTSDMMTIANLERIVSFDSVHYEFITVRVCNSHMVSILAVKIQQYRGRRLLHS